MIKDKNNDDHKDNIATICLKLLNKHKKSFFWDAALADAMLQEIEFVSMEEKECCLELEWHFLVQKKKLADLTEWLWHTNDRINNIEGQQQSHFSFARMKVVKTSDEVAVIKWGNKFIFSIIQQLTDDTKLTSIYENFKTFHYQYTKEDPEEIPTMNHIRGCQLIGYILNHIIGVI